VYFLYTTIMSNKLTDRYSHKGRRMFAIIIGGFFLVLIFIMTVLTIQLAFFTIPNIQKQLNGIQDLTEQTLYRVSAQAQQSR